MAPKLYMLYCSPPVRAVLMTAKALNLDLELIEVDLIKQQHLTPEYLKINPLHTVPTLDDNGFILVDSHAIIAYLVEKYAENDSLYPKDLKRRAIINARLHFDSGTVFSKFLPIVQSIMYSGEKTTKQEWIDALNNIYGLAEALLERSTWIAGDYLTVADFSVFSSITSCDVVVSIDSKRFPKLDAYIKQVTGVAAANENKKGLEKLADLLNSKLVR